MRTHAACISILIALRPPLGSVRCCDHSCKITFFALGRSFDFGDEVTIGGRDAVSSSSAFVSDRLGSLSHHNSDHPTLNAAAALGPTSTPPTAVLLRGHRACRRGDLSADLATSPYFIRTGHKSRYREKGCYVRGRSSGKTGPPATTVSPWYAGGL